MMARNEDFRGLFLLAEAMGTHFEESKDERRRRKWNEITIPTPSARFKNSRVVARLNKSGKVICITLVGCQIEVLPSLSTFTALEELFLDRCRWLWDISEIDESPWIKKVTIENCPAVKELPRQLWALPKLSELRLFRLRGLRRLPSEIGNLSRLKKLQVVECSERLVVPAEIGMLRALEELWLGGFRRIKRLPSYIDYVRLANQFGFQVGDLCSLSELPPGLWELPQLRLVTLTNCIVTAKGSAATASPSLDQFSTSIQEVNIEPSTEQSELFFLSRPDRVIVDEKWCNRIQYLCQLNRAGRQLLSELNISDTLWCHVLAREQCTRDSMFYFLQQKPGLLGDAIQREIVV